jgi:hypothetical protein
MLFVLGSGQLRQLVLSDHVVLDLVYIILQAVRLE